MSKDLNQDANIGKRIELKDREAVKRYCRITDEEMDTVDTYASGCLLILSVASMYQSYIDDVLEKHNLLRFEVKNAVRKLQFAYDNYFRILNTTIYRDPKNPWKPDKESLRKLCDNYDEFEKMISDRLFGRDQKEDEEC